MKKDFAKMVYTKPQKIQNKILNGYFLTRIVVSQQMLSSSKCIESILRIRFLNKDLLRYAAFARHWTLNFLDQKSHLYLYNIYHYIKRKYAQRWFTGSDFCTVLISAITNYLSLLTEDVEKKRKKKYFIKVLDILLNTVNHVPTN